MRAVVTYNKDLKGAKSLPVGVLEEISKFSQNLSGRARAACCSSLQIAYKKDKEEITRSTVSKKRRIHRDSYITTFCKF